MLSLILLSGCLNNNLNNNLDSSNTNNVPNMEILTKVTDVDKFDFEQMDCTKLISEYKCDKNYFCEPTYETIPSEIIEDDDVSLTKLAERKFISCVKRDLSEIKEFEESVDKMYDLCIKTNGSWRNSFIKSILGNCVCNNDLTNTMKESRRGFYFDKEFGCILAEEICENNNGVWKEDEFYKTEFFDQVSSCDNYLLLTGKISNEDQKNYYLTVEWDSESNSCAVNYYYDGCYFNNEKQTILSLIQ